MLEPLHPDDLLSPLCHLHTLQVRTVYVEVTGSPRPAPLFRHFYRPILEVEELTALGLLSGISSYSSRYQSTFWSIRNRDAPVIPSLGNEEILRIKSVLVEAIQ